MSKKEIVTVYYGVKQIQRGGDVNSVNLHSDRDRKEVIGRAVYVNNTFELTGTRAWTVETATFFFNDDNSDVLYFQSNSFTSSGVLPAGEYNYQILGGQGKYLGATGNVKFVVTGSGLRTITLTINLA